MTDIQFDIVDAPVAVTNRDVTQNPYHPVVMAVEGKPGKVARLTLPTQDGDTFKSATQRCRTYLNELSNHLKRTVRVRFTTTDKDNPLTAGIKAEIWVLDHKISRPRKPTDETTSQTPASAPVSLAMAGKTGVLDDTSTDTHAHAPKNATPKATTRNR